jgi:hypothetical protein
MCVMYADIGVFPLGLKISGPYTPCEVLDTERSSALNTLPLVHYTAVLCLL